MKIPNLVGNGFSWVLDEMIFSPPDWNISPDSATIGTFHIIKVDALESTHDLHRNLSRADRIETGNLLVIFYLCCLLCDARLPLFDGNATK